VGLDKNQLDKNCFSRQLSNSGTVLKLMYYGASQTAVTTKKIARPSSLARKENHNLVSKCSHRPVAASCDAVCAGDSKASSTDQRQSMITIHELESTISS
jgi:hypothetical protein